MVSIVSSLVRGLLGWFKYSSNKDTQVYELNRAIVEHRQSTRADEILVVIISAPVIMSFVFALLGSEKMLNRTLDAIEVLDYFPDWYVNLFFITTLSTLGLFHLAKVFGGIKRNRRFRRRRIDLVDNREFNDRIDIKKEDGYSDSVKHSESIDEGIKYINKKEE